ncbi:MAG: leucine-rich repeat protein [Clostridia bacterium]|nr:leucine-rich repeat protein [Clostridia bacterium]
MRNLYRFCLLLLVIAVFAVPAVSGGEGALQLELHGLVVSSVPAGDYATVTFTVGVTSRYVITVNCGTRYTYGYVEEDGTVYRDLTGGGCPVSFTGLYRAGRTYDLYLMFPSAVSFSVRLETETVEFTKTGYCTGKSSTYMDISEPGKKVYLKVLPEVTCDYLFRSVDDRQDAAAVLYDGEWNKIAESAYKSPDDPDRRFFLEAGLVSGSVYYLETGCATAAGTGRFNVTYGPDAVGMDTSWAPVSTAYVNIDPGECEHFILDTNSEYNQLYSFSAQAGADPVIERINTENGNILESDDDSGPGYHFSLSTQAESGALFRVRLIGSGDSARIAVRAVSISAVPVMNNPEFVTPADTKTIASEAFAGIDAENVRIADGVKTLGAKAFANCQSLRRIYIPKSVTSIAPDLLSGCAVLEDEDVIEIYGKAGSAAETFAQGSDSLVFCRVP